MAELDAYFICATPRAGSTLLCELLRSTEVAGVPESYFRAQDAAAWCERLGVRTDSTDYGEFVRAVIASGSTANGVFAARLMWGTIGEVLTALGGLHPDIADDDLRLLREVFGRTRFVFLSREDVLAQAVSWSRAEQTQYWHPGDGDGLPVEPRYDFAQIHWYLQTIRQHNSAWREWFAERGVEPHAVTYEQLAGDAAAVAKKVLRFLGLSEKWDGRMSYRAQRQADAINEEWVSRFREEVSTR